MLFLLQAIGIFGNLYRLNKQRQFTQTKRLSQKNETALQRNIRLAENALWLYVDCDYLLMAPTLRKILRLSLLCINR